MALGLGCGFESHLRQLIFLWKRVVSGVVVLCCVALVVVSFDHVSAL